MFEIYIVDGKKYKVSPDRKEDFFVKFPNATLFEEPGKTTPTAPGAVVEETAAPETVSTELQSEDGSLDLKEPSYFTQLGNAVKGGLVATEYDDYLNKIVFNKNYRPGKEMSDEDVASLFSLLKKEDALSETPGEKAWSNAYDKFEAAGHPFMPDWMYATLAATVKEGVGSFALLGARSFAKMFSDEVLAYGGAGAGVGAGSGALIGAPGGPAGSGAGAIVGSGKGFITGMGAGVEIFGSLSESIKRDLPQNYTEEDLVSFLNDKDKVKSAINRAVGRSGTIALFDLLALKGAGKAVTSIGKKGLEKGASVKATAALSGAAATAIGSTGEFTGELAAQKVVGDELDFKEAVLEVVGISPTAITQAAEAKQFLQKSEYKIGGKKVSRKDINSFIDDNEGLDLARVALNIKNDDLLLEKANKKTRIAQNKIEVDKRITDDSKRTEIAELEYEKQQLEGNKSRTTQNRIKEINAQIDSIQEASIKVGRPTKETAQKKIQIEQEQSDLVEAIKQRTVDAIVGETTEFAKTAAGQIGLEENILSNTKEFTDKLKQDGVNLNETQLSAVNRIGGLAIGNRIYINKETAAKTGQINVGAHEVLHPILNAKVGQNQGEIVSQFKKRLSADQLATMENLMKKYSADKYATEYLNVFSDAIADKSIKFNNNVFTKIGDFIVSLLRPLGYSNINFKDGKGVYNFMKEYHKNIKQGKLSKAAIKAIGGPITAEQATLQFSIADQSFVQELGANQSLQQWKQKGSDVAIEKMYTAGVFEKLIGSKITPQIKQLPDFNQEDFIMDAIGELIPHIRNFNPEVNDNLSGWINSQLQNKINSVLKKGEATQEQFTTDVSEIAERTEFANSEIEDMSAIIAAENERLESLINPLDILPNKLKTEYIDAVKEALKDLDLNTLTFKNLNDLAPEVTGKFFGIPTIKVQKATKNLNQKEIPGVQEILRDNAKILLALLPDGSVKEAASEELINTGTLVPRKILQAFYTKQERSTKGAGLFPFELNKNITVQDFYKAFGIKPDGGITGGLGGQTPQAQSMLAMIRLTGKLMTNTTVRSLIELQNDKAGIINLNIGAGTSEAQLSISKETKTYQGSLNNATEKLSGALLANHGLTEQEIEQVINYPILLANKSNGNQTFPIDVVEKYIEMQQKFREFIPASLYNIGIQLALNGYSGNHYRVNTYGVTFKPTHMKKIIDENGNMLTDSDSRVKDLKASLEAETRNAAYQTKENRKNYSSQTIEVLNKFENLVKNNKNTLKGLSFLLNSNNLSTIKGNLKGKDIQAILDKNSNKELNTLRQTLFNLLKYLETDFIANAKKGQDKVDAIIFAKQLAGANSQILDGEKSFATLQGGIIYETTPKNGWQHEHMDASVDVATNGYINVVKGTYTPVQSRSLLISADDAKAMDKSIGKTATYQEKIKWLKENSKGKLYVNNKIQFSLANTFYDKIEANKAAYKKIKKEDKFDMLETVTRQMFPESANQPRGSYESLTPEQRFEVFNRMQENGMIAPGVQFSLAENLAEKISNKSEIDATAEISEKKARLLGKNKGKWKFFIPPSADDFAGLMYYMVGKGKQGNADLAWFKENLFDPFAKGVNQFSTYRQFTMSQFRRMKKLLRSKNVKLKATNSTGFTNEVAVRVYVWATNGHEVPGLSEAEVKEMVNIVSNDPSLRNFAGQIINLTNFAETPAPEKSWDGGTLTTDILDYLNTSSREKFLEEYLSNAEEIFGKFGQSGEIEGETANRLRAAFGDNYIEALSDVLYRMKTGRRRITGSNRLTNQFVNWINDSVGAIMFFNTRSALLQQLSFVNFVNFSDNNPLAASRAFINQPQFWSDYVSLFNSDFLKERRSGLKTDVNADEIARAAEEGRNPIRSVIASLLKKGFLPTQVADSHAIALGGASFYRNRLNRYIKEGMTQEDAAKQAFVDFQEIAEETQQSSRPDRISMQQASGLGRLILAFANTPMQYARLTKKAALDLINRRGDWKTNLSKLMYYGAVQNIIFSSLQTALFALAFDDEEEEKTRDRYFRIANGTADGLLRGLGFGGAAVAAGKNMVLEGIRQSKLARPDYEEVAYEALKLSPPISSKIEKLASAGRMFTYRNTREQMLNAGFTLDNPIFESAGKIISATTNLPADRVIRKLDNLSTPVRQDVETWQAVSLALGYSKWDVGLIESKAKKPQTSTKGLKKQKEKKRKQNILKRFE